jgi:hypothetical protein
MSDRYPASHRGLTREAKKLLALLKLNWAPESEKSRLQSSNTRVI